ncbi:hypothetical protein [Nocardioides sp. YIM 152588]
MNIVISAFVGALVATAALVGGVNVVQGDQSPVAETTLYSYASE